MNKFNQLNKLKHLRTFFKMNQFHKSDNLNQLSIGPCGPGLGPSWAHWTTARTPMGPEGPYGAPWARAKTLINTMGPGQEPYARMVGQTVGRTDRRGQPRMINPLTPGATPPIKDFYMDLHSNYYFYAFSSKTFSILIYICILL